MELLAGRRHGSHEGLGFRVLGLGFRGSSRVPCEKGLGFRGLEFRVLGGPQPVFQLFDGSLAHCFYVASELFGLVSRSRV